MLLRKKILIVGDPPLGTLSLLTLAASFLPKNSVFLSFHFLLFSSLLFSSLIFSFLIFSTFIFSYLLLSSSFLFSSFPSLLLLLPFLSFHITWLFLDPSFV